MDAVTFLTELFGDAAGPQALISVWTLPDKVAGFFAKPEDAATYLHQKLLGVHPHEYDSTMNAYFGCGLYRPGIAKGRRGSAEDVVGIPGVWADIDYGPAHKKPNLPPTPENAAQVLMRIGLPPSLIVHSGHGLQPWWLFKELLWVADRDVADLSRMWGATVTAVAKGCGYTVDSVWDLARVLRPPGTVNRGKGEPVAVTVDYNCAFKNKGNAELVRYDPDDIVAACVSDLGQGSSPWEYKPDLVARAKLPRSTPKGSPKAETNQQPLNLDPDRKLTVREGPGSLIERTIAVDRRFELTWLGKRTDLPDGSPSSYDMALAHLGVSGEWTDQQICDAILLWRRNKGFDTGKAARRQYIVQTIAAARVEHVEEHPAAGEPLRSEEAPKNPSDHKNKKRQKIVQDLNDALRVSIAEWVQFGVADADFTLILTKGQCTLTSGERFDSNGENILIGPTKAVTGQGGMIDQIYAVTGRKIRRRKNSTWDNILDRLGKIREVKENPEESREFEGVEGITTYLAAGGKHGRDVVTKDFDDAIENKRPLRRAGRLHIVLDSLFEHLTGTAGGRHLTKQELRKQLEACGFVGTSVKPADSLIKSQVYWRDDRAYFR